LTPSDPTAGSRLTGIQRRVGMFHRMGMPIELPGSVAGRQIDISASVQITDARKIMAVTIKDTSTVNSVLDSTRP